MKRIIQILPLLFLGLISSLEVIAQAERFESAVVYNNSSGLPFDSQIYISISAKDADVTKRGQIYVFDGEPTTAQIEEKIYNGPDRGHFFTTYRNTSPIAFDLNFGVLNPLFSRDKIFDKVSVSYGELGNETRPLVVARTVRYITIPDFLWLGTRFTNIPISEGFTFNFDRRHVVMNSQYDHTKLLIYRLYTGSTHVKTVILPIGVIGNNYEKIGEGNGPVDIITILRAPPGDKSSISLTQGKSYSKEFNWSSSKVNSKTVEESATASVGLELGPISAGGEVTSTSSKEYTKAKSQGGANSIRYDLETTYTNTSKSDKIVARQPYVDFILQTWVIATTSPSNDRVDFQSNTDVILYPTKYNWTREYTEQQLQGDDGEIIKLRQRGKQEEADFWEEAMRFNAKIKNAAFRNEEVYNSLNFDKRFATTQSRASSFSQEVSFNSTTSLEIKGSVGIKAGPISAGGSYSKKNTISVTTSAANGNTNVDEDATAVSYHIDDNDGDRIEYKVHTDPVFGTPIFELLPVSETSCPYEGGVKVDDPGIVVIDPVTGKKAKKAKISDLGPEETASFEIVLKNNSKFERTYAIAYLQRNYNRASLSFDPADKDFLMAPNDSVLLIIDVDRSGKKTDVAYEDIQVIFGSKCSSEFDNSVADTVLISAFYGDSDENRAPDNNLSTNALLLTTDGSLQTTYINKFNKEAKFTNINANSAEEEAAIVPVNWNKENDSGPEITNSVWFKFVVSSPTTEVRLCDPINDGFDSQIAVYKVGDINDMSTYNILNSNDRGLCRTGNKTNESAGVQMENLTLGDTLYVLVDGFKGAQSDFGITIESLPPKNDENCEAINLDLNSYIRNGTIITGLSNYNSTSEINESMLIPQATNPVFGWKEDEIQHSVWFRFSAPKEGAVSIEVLNATFDTQLAVYGLRTYCGGENYDKFELYKANDDVGLDGGFGSKLILKGLPYETTQNRIYYYILVDGYQGAMGTFDLQVKLDLPDNDLIENAITLELDAVGQGVFNNGGATASDEEQVIAPPVSELNKPNGWSDKPGDSRARQIERSVWFKFVAPNEGAVQISTCNQASFFVQLALYKVGDLEDFSTYEYLGADDGGHLCRLPPSSQYPNGTSVRGSILDVTGLEGGETYYLVVDGSLNSFGQFSIDLITQKITEIPANDDACDAIALKTDGNVQKGFNNFAATVSSTERKILPAEWLDKSIGGTVWFTFVASESGEAEISLCDLANFDTQIAVFEVEDCKVDTNFVLVAANEDGPKSCATNGDSYLPLKNLTAGKKYYIVVDGYGGNRGSFGIIVRNSITPGPANDDVVNAIELPVDGEVKSGYSNSFATVRDKEQDIRPVPANNQDCTTGWCDKQVDNSVWFKFIAPADGKVNISTCDLADFDTQLALYTATSVSDFSTFSLKAANDAGPEDCSTFFDSYLPVTGLTAGETYYIMVDGFDGDNGAFSISLTGVADVKAPTAPTSPTAGTITETTAEVSWTAASDNVGVAEYEVFVDGESKGKTSETSFTITGLAGSKTYAVTIVALDAAGNKSSASTSVSVTTKTASDAQAPSSPTGLTATEIRTTGIDISWAAATDNVGVKEYKVYVDGSLTATVTGTTFSLSGLTAGTAYSIYVTATDAAGNTSTASTALKVTTSTGAVVDVQAPSAPSNVVANEVTDTGVLLSWTASTDNVGITQYDIYVDGTLVGSSSETSFIVSNLTKLTAYSIQVVAKDAAGNASEKSTALKVTTVEEGTLSVIEFDAKDAYHIYPNPFSTRVNLRFPGAVLKEESVEIVDLTGRVVLRPNVTIVTNGLAKMNLENLPAGLHFLMIKAETGVVYKRLIKR